MTLKEFCMTLQQCANKLEEEIKYNINDVHNHIYSNRLNETKISLEKAKDYHYKEIMDSVGEIIKGIKKVLFHQDKIEWLSNENNFTKDELRRFSYVKRQVFAFSKPEEVVPVPPPVVPTHTVKKQIRRTASEVSVGSLEAWEKYLDQKDKEEKELKETVSELKPLVPKRPLSNARRRKKFVSSTMGGFLEGDEKSRNLDSIFEDASSAEENERLSYSKSLESLDKMIECDKQNISYNQSPPESTINDNHVFESDHVSLKGCLQNLHELACGNETATSIDTTDKDNDSLSDSIKLDDELALKPEINSNIINIINDSVLQDEETIKNEIINTFLSDAVVDENNIEEELAKEAIKPKIVDVIYKKKPS